MRSFILRFVPLNIHYLLPLTILFMIGVFWQSTPYCLSPWIMVIAIFIAIGCVCIKRSTPYILISLGILFFVLGAFLFQRQRVQHEHFFYSAGYQAYMAQATITEIIPIEQKGLHAKIMLSIQQLTSASDCTAINSLLPSTIAVYTRDAKSFLVQDVIEFGPISFKPLQNNSFAQYLIKEGIITTFFLPSFKATLINRPQRSWLRLIGTIKTDIFTTLQQKMSPKCFAFFSSLFLGNKSINEFQMIPLKQQFRNWGISHYLARSGLHMVIFVIIWEFLLSLLPLALLYKQCLLLIISLCYAILSFPSTSFNRALLAFVLYKLCNIMQQQSHGVHILTITTLILLILSPSQLFFLDFQLSFGLSFVLAWINQLRAQRKTLFSFLS